jgi:hypothetical protein
MDMNIFFAIEKGNSKVHDLLQDHHMFTVAEAIDSYEKRVHPTVTGKYSYEEIERDDFELSWLVVESLLSEEIRDKMRVRYDRNINFYDYPGGLLVMMALEISNASVSYDIEGAQVKLKTIATQIDSSRTTMNHMASSVVLLHQHLGNYDRICNVT